MKDPVFVYAYRHRGRLVYVGQTVNMEERRTAQFSASNLRNRIPSDSEMVLLRVSDYENSQRLERQIIAALKRKGEADFNIALGSLKPKRTVTRNPVVWKETGEEFGSVNSCARRLGISSHVITQRLGTRISAFEVRYFSTKLDSLPTRRITIVRKSELPRKRKSKEAKS